MTDGPIGSAGDERPDPLRLTLRELALRVEAARRLAPPAGVEVLRSIVEATVALFDAEAASLALHDPAANRLVFSVAAGEQGQGVVGLAIPADQGVAGYVFATGQPLAISDVARDARFGRETAEQTGYVPRSLVAVPLLDDEGAIGVLEVLDKRGAGGFDLRDVELASVFARQATVAIRSSRVERDTAAILGSVLRSVGSVAPDGSADGDPDAAFAAALDDAIGAAVRDVATADDDPLWVLADQVARLRAADPAEVDLVRELLAVLVRRAERGRGGRPR
ncbi:MAG TPA: GAF domain-containing protein [Candidatus Limnocylindrales bacterium]|nr:GAF domain-containing protein [Candidatus Limnocylindrales bacterium]